eukprot:350331-Chlamydomonas_euryale.AAC.8
MLDRHRNEGVKGLIIKKVHMPSHGLELHSHGLLLTAALCVHSHWHDPSVYPYPGRFKKQIEHDL